ncbi:MAG: phage baseplate assembly protein V [Desulfovibrionaceae bacterium]
MAGINPAPDLRALLKRVVELAMPDLRAYYRVPRKGKVVATYASDGRYWADVQPLRNDESVDVAEPVVPHVEIPVAWGGPQRGIVCPPAVGTHVVLAYFDGDPNYPFIAAVRWQDNQAPACEVGGLVIQREPGTHIKIDAGNNVITITPANRTSDIGGDAGEAVGGDKTAQVGGAWTVQVGGAATIQAGGAATIQAPSINLVGNISSAGAGGGVGVETKSADTAQAGSYQLTGPMTVTGDVVVSGSITATEFIQNGGGA